MDARRSERRARGELDVADLIIGVALLFVMPLVCFFLGALLAPKAKEDPYAFRNQPKLSVPPDSEEVEAKWKWAEQFYTVNAKGLVKNAFEQDDAVLKEHFRRWCSSGLKQAKSALDDVKSLIDNKDYPEARSQFASYLPRIEALEREIDADLAKVKALDILGQDSR